MKKDNLKNQVYKMATDTRIGQYIDREEQIKNFLLLHLVRIPLRVFVTERANKTSVLLDGIDYREWIDRCLN